MEKDARGVKCNKDNRTLMWKGVRRLCRQFKTTRRLWAHTKKAKLCSSFLLLRLDINFFFSYTGEKKRKKNKPCLTSLFWPKQIGLLVLAKREEFIHEQGWNGKSHGPSIWLTVQRLVFVFCIGLSFYTSSPREDLSVALLSRRQCGKWIKTQINLSEPPFFLPGCCNWSLLWEHSHKIDGGVFKQRRNLFPWSSHYSRNSSLIKEDKPLPPGAKTSNSKVVWQQESFQSAVTC